MVTLTLTLTLTLAPTLTLTLTLTLALTPAEFLILTDLKGLKQAIRDTLSLYRRSRLRDRAYLRDRSIIESIDGLLSSPAQAEGSADAENPSGSLEALLLRLLFAQGLVVAS